MEGNDAILQAFRVKVASPVELLQYSIDVFWTFDSQV